jgi:hypothetical protein
MFRLFNIADSTVEIMFRQMRKYTVMIIGELVKYEEDSVVAYSSYGISVHVKWTSTGNLILDSALSSRF